MYDYRLKSIRSEKLQWSIIHLNSIINNYDRNLMDGLYKKCLLLLYGCLIKNIGATWNLY